MEHLNKQQVILICLLVAIVTSITTGIVTVSLLDQSGQGAGQTIYQVIERTVEKVVPDPTPSKPVIIPATTPKEIPLSDIVDKVGKNIIRINRKDASGASTFVTIAVAIGDKGALIGPKTSNIVREGESLSAVLPDGTEYEVTVSKTTLFKDNDVFLLKDLASISKLPKPALGSFTSLKLGSNIIALGGRDKDNVVSTGIVSEFKNSSTDSSTSTARNIVATNIRLSSSLAGWILLDTSGNLLGFATSNVAGEPAEFFDASVIRTLGGEIF